jgi:PAS domain S-box-containing protein
MEVALLTDLNGPYTFSSALGDNECVAGTFHVDADGWKIDWSDGMYQLHGYERGEVVPTLELLYAHKHPEDRPRCEAIVAQVAETGGYFCMYHRIIDARGRTRRVLTSGDGIVNEAGEVTAIEGVMVDLTTTLQRETEQIARDAVLGATSTRSVIDQARGILMGQLRMGSEDAFQMLVSTSSHRNVKLVVVAAELVQLANSANGQNYLDNAVRAIQAQGRSAAAARRRAG